MIPEHLKAPADLSGEGLTLFNDTITEFVERKTEPTAGEFALIVSAARSIMLAERIERELATAPLMVDGFRGVQRANPLLSEVSSQRRTASILLGKVKNA